MTFTFNRDGMMSNLKDFLNREEVEGGDYFKALPYLKDALVQIYVRSAISGMVIQEVYTCHHNCVQSSSHHRRQWEWILTEGQAFQTCAT